jgi:hypothetical protein
MDGIESPTPAFLRAGLKDTQVIDSMSQVVEKIDWDRNGTDDHP